MRRRAALAAGAGFVAAASVWALLQAVGAPERDRSVSVPGTPQAVAIAVDQGDVDVRASAGATHLEVRATERGVVPAARRAEHEGGESRVTWSCRLWTNCRADIAARVPSGVAIRVATDFGDIALRGPVGDVDVETGSGGVEATNVRSGVARVTARSGDVDVHFAERPRLIRIEVSSGNVIVRLPAGPFRIRATTRAGTVRLQGVRHDEAAQESLEIETTAGDVTLLGA